MKMISALAVPALVLMTAACEEATSTLQGIEDTAAQAQTTAAEINDRSAQIQQAVNDPVGALRATVGATFSRTATDQPGVYVLTDLQTGCQFLGTYAADGNTVSSIAPRIEATSEGGTRQRCIAIPGLNTEGQPEG